MKKTGGRGSKRRITNRLLVMPMFVTILLMVLWHTLTENWEFARRERAMHFYMQMYLPLLLSACVVTAGYVVAWALGGGGIDLGPPNARV